MKRLDLRLPDDLHERLVKLAEREERSLHGQIVYLLRRGVEQAEGSTLNFDAPRPGVRWDGPPPPRLDVHIDPDRTGG
jgi:hypothetical protein